MAGCLKVATHPPPTLSEHPSEDQATVMVFGVVSSEGGPHHNSSICPQGLRVNADVDAVVDVDADADADAYVETLQIIVVEPCRLG
ncbi:hypothetical protein ACTXT7_004465 [Hymenolepis weldensis]